MHQKIIAARIFHFGSFLQNQVLPELLRRVRQHHLIRAYIETAVIACYRLSIWLDYNSGEAHYKLGEIFQRQQKWQAAATAFEQVTKFGSFQIAHTYYNLGRMLFKLKRYEASIAALRQAIELNQKKHVYYQLIGDALSEQGELDKAINIYQIALQKNIAITYPHFGLKFQEKQQLSAPNFLIIGQTKCGTTSLYAYLKQHPQILPALTKEIKFWHSKSNFDRGLDWYLAHFSPICSGQNLITGEATPEYLSSPEAAQRLWPIFPEMKLIILLRNPVDRAISQYYFRCKRGGEHRSLEKAIFSELKMLTQQREIDHHNLYYLFPGIYINSIITWMELFPQKQFLILKSEDFFSATASTVNQVFQFLAVEPYQLEAYSKKNIGNYPPISQSMHRTLSDYFRTYNQQLEEYLDRKFNWDVE
ncbi:MAG: tetratricopeptide repeat protein [Symploca sp. SIO1A3]|nr:tetratricopeptide repeat protein [Symploca sp. SIO1A3]